MGPTRVALVGFGAVGQALARQIRDREAPVRIVAATDTSGTAVDPEGLDPQALVEAKREEGLTAGPGRWTDWGPQQAAAQAPADVIVQLTPTNLDAPGTSLATIEAALEADKDLVTAAKDALATAPHRVREHVQASAGRLTYSATVGAGIPVLEAARSILAGDRIERVEAVLNGSTSYLLARMAAGRTREQALAEAREAGLLETDPTVDLTGRDAAAKAAILHQAVFGSRLSVDDVDVQGIGAIGEPAARRAREGGFAIRLVARIRRRDVRVGPVELARESPLVAEGPSCRVRITAEAAGEIVLGGPGAGPRETASALLGDSLRLARTPAGSTVPGDARSVPFETHTSSDVARRSVQ